MEKSGFVCTSRNAPNSGWPWPAQPRGSSASLSTSANPSGLRGQPSARAIGSHMAMTSGVRTSDGFSSGASARSASKFTSRPHSEEAGDQATGFRLPEAIRDSASPEATFWPLTTTGRPFAVSPLALNSLISGASSFSFSGE